MLDERPGAANDGRQAYVAIGEFVVSLEDKGDVGEVENAVDEGHDGYKVHSKFYKRISCISIPCLTRCGNVKRKKMMILTRWLRDTIRILEAVHPVVPKVEVIDPSPPG